MKKIAIGLVLCVGLWYFFIGGRKLDEPMVRKFYQELAHAVYSRDAELLCKKLSRKAVIEGKTTMMGQTVESSQNREESCEAQRKTFESFREIGDRMGGILTIEYEHHIDAVELSPNRKSATVTGTSVLKMGETVMQFKTAFTHQLERELGQVRLVRSDEATVVRLGGRGAMSQSDFFNKK